MIITYVTKKGKSHDASQDVILINDKVISNYAGTLDDKLKQVCIADGVGGVPGGYEAAQFLLNRFASHENISSKEELFDYLSKLNVELIEYASQDENKRAMATTFTGLTIIGKELVLMHAGNTRLYSYSDNELVRLSTDHTNYQAMVVDGPLHDMDEEECDKNTIYCCFGTGNAQYLNSLYVGEVKLQTIPDFLMLSSDGIHDYVDDLQMSSILNDNLDDRNKILSLMNAAEENGSEDDMSVIILRSKSK